MKSSILIVSLLFVSFFSQAQKKQIKIDVESTIYKLTTVKAPGKYLITLVNTDPKKSYEININRKFHEYDPLSIPKTDSLNKNGLESITEPKVIDTISLSKNQDLSIKIDVFKTETDKDGKKETNKEKTFNYKYITERKGTWQTTFGFNFIALGNKDSYFSKQVDSTYSITKGTNQNKIDFHPSIMFTWLPNNSETFNLGITGGLGYDLEKSLSVFFGGSLVYNQNITLSAGFAFHNQKLLNSQYKEGDVLKENLTFDQLHKDYIRFNPFISIAFRLDKSPF